MTKISPDTRRNILDTIRAEKIIWNGRLSEEIFLNRIFKLQELPSFDSRYENMLDDWYQHRMNNSDWPDDWVLDDPRLNLIEGNENEFLKFLCEMIHPVVRQEEAEARKLADSFNGYLSHDGIKLEVEKIVNNRSVFKAVVFDAARIEVLIKPLSTQEFVIEQMHKCERKLSENDFDGAITNARSLAEGVFADIYKQCTGSELPGSGDLATDFKAIKKLLNLSSENDTNASLKAMTNGLSTIIQAVDSLSNDMGDRHRRTVKPERRHAKLVVNAAKTIADFMNDTLASQQDTKQILLDQLLTILSGSKRGWSYETLHQDPEVAAIISQCDIFTRNLLKSEIILNLEVKNFKTSDIFFAAMRIFLNDLNAGDIEAILKRGTDNDQLIGMDSFIDLLKTQSPHLMPEQRYLELRKSYFLNAECMRGRYQESIINLA